MWANLRKLLFFYTLSKTYKYRYYFLFTWIVAPFLEASASAHSNFRPRLLRSNSVESSSVLFSSDKPLSASCGDVTKIVASDFIGHFSSSSVNQDFLVPQPTSISSLKGSLLFCNYTLRAEIFAEKNSSKLIFATLAISRENNFRET